MSKVPLRELRRYGELFDEADAARNLRELGLVAQRADQLERWILLQSVKDKLAERARDLGLRCRDSDRCFDDLISRVRTRSLFRDENPRRDATSAGLVDWAMAEVASGSPRAVRRVRTDDGRDLDVEMHVGPASKFAVHGHFWGPQDPDASWRGRVELEVGLPPDFDDPDELRAVLARTIRHELEHAHDVDVPAVPPYDGVDPFEAFAHYVLSPREVSAWSAHLVDEARREAISMDELLVGNRRIIERGALERGASRPDAAGLADEAVSAWRRELPRLG